tara:strand:- start:629 stop:874 length:246 start_codon:yes stop_codon:yes gene_type:complete
MLTSQPTPSLQRAYCLTSLRQFDEENSSWLALCNGKLTFCSPTSKTSLVALNDEMNAQSVKPEWMPAPWRASMGLLRREKG